jgi:hypothetical protein
MPASGMPVSQGTRCNPIRWRKPGKKGGAGKGKERQRKERGRKRNPREICCWWESLLLRRLVELREGVVRWCDGKEPIAEDCKFAGAVLDEAARFGGERATVAATKKTPTLECLVAGAWVASPYPGAFIAVLLRSD